jgi:tetratricopeptide (TPR) repeat protein
MMREDYILAWIRRYVRWLAEIAGLVKTQDFEGALRRLDVVLRDLLGLGPDSVTSLAEGEILARLTLEETPEWAQDKCAVLAALLKQLGVVCANQQRAAESRDCFLKALHLVLGLKLSGGADRLAEYVPKVDELVDLLKDSSLPARTWATLTLFHEQSGQFAKAEDALFALAELEPSYPETWQIGRGFYERLRVLSDAALETGDLPRAELEAGWAQFKVQYAPRGQAPL